MENPIVMLLVCWFLLYKATKMVFENEKPRNKKILKTYKFLEKNKNA